jgi:hypothetical protein
VTCVQMRNWLLHAVMLSLAMLSFGQSPKETNPGDRISAITDKSSSYLIMSGFDASKTSLAQIDPRLRARFAQRPSSISPRPQIAHLPNGVDDSGAVPLTGKVIDGMSNPNAQRRNIDWSVDLGAGHVAAYQSPVKYGFNVNNPPDCTNDYVVFPLAVAGVTGGQANLLAINNLYSGENGSPCTGPTVNWAYNGSTVHGKILTSAEPSLDGTKIMYVESATSSTVFHVLTWKVGEGTSATASAAPTKVGSCTASTSCLASVTLSTTSSDTVAFPWVTYGGTDKSFVATDDGTIYRLGCTFTCPLNTNPTIDWSFKLRVPGTGGSVPQPTEVLYNDSDGYLFVADTLGEVWTINASGSTPSVAFGPVMVGGGGCSVTNPPGRTGTPSPCTANGGSYGVMGSMVLDSTTDMLYPMSGNDGTPGASAVVVQTPVNLSSQIRVHVGLGSVGNTTTNVDLHYGSFDNTYWSSSAHSNGHLILCGTGTGDTSPWQYVIGFSGYPLMDSSATQGIQQVNTKGIPCTDSAEFYNPNLQLRGLTNDHDLLLWGLVGSGLNGNIISADISWATQGIQYPYGEMFVNYTGGVSDTVIDNDGSAPGESGMYFSTLQKLGTAQGSCNVGEQCAIKLSQLNLN